MAEFVLNVQDIGEGGKDYRFPIERSWLDAQLRGCDARAEPSAGPGLLQLHAQRNGREILITGRVQAQVVLRCARCLGDAMLRIDTELVSLQAPGPPPSALPGEEVELEAEDLVRDWFDGEHIVLDALVRELVLLEFPIKPLCSEDCPGLPVPEHVRGPERLTTSVDPRLAPLARFLQPAGSDDAAGQS